MNQSLKSEDSGSFTRLSNAAMASCAIVDSSDRPAGSPFLAVHGSSLISLIEGWLRSRGLPVRTADWINRYRHARAKATIARRLQRLRRCVRFRRDRQSQEALPASGIRYLRLRSQPSGLFRTAAKILDPCSYLQSRRFRGPHCRRSGGLGRATEAGRSLPVGGTY